MIDEELYQRATDELNSDRRRPHLWARACALSSDDHDEARYLYTNLRVEELIAEREAGTLGPSSAADETAGGAAPQELGLEPLALDDTAASHEPELDDTEPNAPFVPDEPEGAVRSLPAGSHAPRGDDDGHGIDFEPDGGFDGSGDASGERFGDGPAPLDGRDGGAPAGTSGRDELRLDLDTSAVEFDAGEIAPAGAAADPEFPFEADDARGTGAGASREAPPETPEPGFDADETPAPGPDPDARDDAHRGPAVGAALDAGVGDDDEPRRGFDLRGHVDPEADRDVEATGEFDSTGELDAGRDDPSVAGGRPHAGGHAPDGLDGDASTPPARAVERGRLHDAADQLDEVLRGPDAGASRVGASGARGASGVRGDYADARDLDALLEDRRRPGSPDVGEEAPAETLELVEDDTGPGAKWSVLESEDGALRAVPRGVSWTALAATLPWLLARGLVATALVYAALWIVSLGGAAMTGLAWLEAGAEVSDSTRFAFFGFVAIAVLGLVLAPLLRANRWLTDKLARQGWGVAGELRAGSADEAIARFRELDAGRR